MNDPRLPRGLAAVAALLLIVALVGLASLPTGYPSAAAAVPDGQRVAARAPVGEARLMVLSTSRRLSLLVAYRGDKGWQRVVVDPVPAATVAAWAATRGSEDVPALSAVFGRAPGVKVRVRWADGTVAEVTPAGDGTYLATRPGRVRSASVDVLGEDGAVLTEVNGP